MSRQRSDPLARARATFDLAWDIAEMLGPPYTIGAHSDEDPEAVRSPERQKLFDDVRTIAKQNSKTSMVNAQVDGLDMCTHA